MQIPASPNTLISLTVKQFQYININLYLKHQKATEHHIIKDKKLIAKRMFT